MRPGTAFARETAPAAMAARPSLSDERRPFGSGPRGVRVGLGAAFLAVAVAAGFGLHLLAERGGRTAAVAARATASKLVTRQAQAVDYTKRPIKTSGTTYGYVPAWLGRTRVPVARVVTATPSRPRLAIQGDTVRVQLPGAQVLARAAGPAVPEEGRFPLPKTSPSTFAVTLTVASAPIRIAPAQFAVIDEQGRLHKVQVTNLKGGVVPAEVKPGEAVELKMYTVLPTGEGRLMWAPTPGNRPVVQWDYDNELD